MLVILPMMALCKFNFEASSWFFLKKNGPIPASFVYFRSFLVTISIQTEKSIDGVLGIRTRGRRMVGADETTELWRPPKASSWFMMNASWNHRGSLEGVPSKKALNDYKIFVHDPSRKPLWLKYQTTKDFIGKGPFHLIYYFSNMFSIAAH